MANTPKLAPENQFPEQAISESVQVQPDPNNTSGNVFLTFALASAADLISPWGTLPKRRDQQLREFWPTESYLAGAVTNVCFRNSAYDWEIKGTSDVVIKAVTGMLNNAIAGDKIGWTDFIKRISQDLYCQDNGAFIEIIRDPSVDATSKFKGAMAPVIGIAHLDAGQCVRTGNPTTPVLYTDADEKVHKLQWYQVISFSDMPSPIEKMHGIGVCAVSRALRLAQIMRSIAIFKDEKISGRHFKSIHLVSGVSQTELTDAKKRGREEADNRGQLRYIDPVILASLDPEKPVSTATIDLASLPDGFDLDQEMQWYISGLALDFGVDYQEFAPLPGGNIGSGSQSLMLHKKSSGKGPRVFMDTITEAFENSGVLPRGSEMVFKDKNKEEEFEAQEIRTMALEEAAIAVNSRILSPQAAAEDLVRRGIYTKEQISGLDEFWKLAQTQPPPGQPVGSRGGNTIAENAGRQNTGKPNLRAGDRLRKAWNVLNGN